MSYLIAIGTSDGKNIDLKFGEVSQFLIYEVSGKDYRVSETRVVKDVPASHEKAVKKDAPGCQSGGCSGSGHGCAGSDAVIAKVDSISDCRCVLCAKVGFQAQKQFERRAISVFDIACSIEEALEKIASYYDKIDSHKSLRK